MIRYSHVSLLILCESVAEADAITTRLGVPPTRVRENKSQSWSKEKGHAEKISYDWMFDSPKSHTDADPTDRLWALADAIEPFAAKLQTLEERFKPWVDIIYHITPQHPHGIQGEFDWLRMPAQLMRRFADWNLNVSYETFWFNHPDWVSPTKRSLLQRVKRFFRITPARSLQPTIST